MAADDLLESLDERARQRATPRLGITLAAAGVVLAVGGVLAVSGDQTVESSGETNRLPGIVLCAAAVAIGYAIVAKARTGPLAAAGVAASVLALPPLIFFLTVSDRVPERINLNAILLIAGVVYVASYVVGPGRGHTFYLAAAVVFVWLFVLHQVKDLQELPGSFFTFCFGGECEDPDTTNWGVVSTAIGAGYLVVTRLLDRRRFHAAATTFVFGGSVAITLGLLLVADEVGTAGTAIAAVVAGAVVAYLGATSERRGTTWYGGFGIVAGLAALIGETMGDSAVGAGFVAIAVGAGLVFLGHLVATNWQEPDELTPGPSKLVLNAGGSQPPHPPQPPFEPPPPPSPFEPPPPPFQPQPPPPSPPPPRRRERPLRPPDR